MQPPLKEASNVIEPFLLKEMAQRALSEDLIYGDRTTETLFPHPLPGTGSVIAKEDLIVAGLDLFETVFSILDPNVQLTRGITMGQMAKNGTEIVQIVGDGRAILKGERTALNFLQRLCGIATLTHQFVERVSGTAVKIVDTRKTTPGFRALEKEAVRLGGGMNHRFHLGDMVLIKDNHIALAKGIVNAVKQTRAALSHPLKIEVETTNLIEVSEAIKSEADIILLDNMPISEIRRAVAAIREKSPSILIEVSGGITLKNVEEIARCGVDMISIGALTHSAPAVDISLEITPQ